MEKIKRQIGYYHVMYIHEWRIMYWTGDCFSYNGVYILNENLQVNENRIPSPYEKNQEEIINEIIQECYSSINEGEFDSSYFFNYLNENFIINKK